MAVGRPDYTQNSQIQGEYNNTPRTVVLDSDGNIIAVIKGDYEGALQSVALDSEHRMICRTLDSIDTTVQFGAMVETGNSDCVVSGNVVPQGKIWKINNILTRNQNSSASSVLVAKIKDYVLYILFYDSNILSDKSTIITGNIWLAEGEKLQVLYRGLDGNATIWLHYVGIQLNKV